jgi:hypothetical protein
MERDMKPWRGVGAALPVLLAGLAASAQPQPLDRALDGKTCQGTFNSGHERLASEGALQLRFVMSGGRLTAQFQRLVSPDAYARAAFALTRTGRKNPPLDTSGYESLGEVHDISVAGDRITFVDPIGARVELTYKRGDLSGESDPRGGSDPRMTRLQFVNLYCR